MNFRALVILLFLVCSTATSLAQQAKIEGNVTDYNDKPVAALRIIGPGGQAAVTDSKGHFTIFFPESVQPGVAARIQLNSTRWVIYLPMFGSCTTQNAKLNYEVLQVVVVPKGSALALSPKRLSKLITQWASERAKLSAEVRNLKANQDDTALLRRYATEYGFTYNEFLVAAKRWAETKEHDDKEEQAIKEYWHKNFAGSAQLAEESAQMAETELKQAIEKTREVSLKVIRRYMLAGNAYTAQYKFMEALGVYRKIDRRFELKELSKENFIEEWATLKLLIGNSKAILGERIAGKDGRQLLSEALSEYEQSMSVYTRENSREVWAKIQNNVGIVLLSLGERADGTESVKLLKEAVIVYRAALDVFATEKLNENRAHTQNNLGLTLSSLGERLGDADSSKYLEQAVAEYRAAIEILTRARFPQEWAGIQDNLGSTLSSLGERVSSGESIKYLEDAVKAHRAALQVRTRKQVPEEWAKTQSNLANGLASLGERVSGQIGTTYLKDAVAAYRSALEVQTREHLPQDWAKTQNNLGLTLLTLGEQENDSDSLSHFKEAVATIRAALEIRSREYLPQDWARTQNNLGQALSTLSERLSAADAIECLEGALNAFQAALEVFNQRQFPQDWSATQNNLGNALSRLGERTMGTEGIHYLNNAVATYHKALECRDREKAPQTWADTQHNLGNALLRLGERLSGAEAIKHLNGAVEAYRAALEVITREHLPRAWLPTQNNLGLALLISGERMSGPDRIAKLEAALAAFRIVFEVFGAEEIPQRWVIVHRRLTKACIQVRDWSCAAEAATNVLAFDSNDKDAYLIAPWLYHNVLFRFDKAFTMHQRWLRDHPKDTIAQISFAEAHFSTGRFAECERRVNVLLNASKVPMHFRTVLHVIEISSMLARGHTSAVPAKLEALIAEIASQPTEFKVNWNFNGCKRFIEGSERLSPFRTWITDLLGALSEDHITMLTALKKAQGNFKWAQPVVQTN